MQVLKLYIGHQHARTNNSKIIQIHNKQIMLEQRVNQNIEDMKVCKESKIGAWNEYVIEILRERNLKVINVNKIANKVM